MAFFHSMPTGQGVPTACLICVQGFMQQVQVWDMPPRLSKRSSHTSERAKVWPFLKLFVWNRIEYITFSSSNLALKDLICLLERSRCLKLLYWHHKKGYNESVYDVIFCSARLKRTKSSCGRLGSIFWSGSSPAAQQHTGLQAPKHEINVDLSKPSVH